MSLRTSMEVLLGAVVGLSLVGPAPRRQIPSIVCLVQLVGGIALLLAGVVVTFGGGDLSTGLALAGVAMGVGIPVFWTARAPFAARPVPGRGPGGNGGGEPPVGPRSPGGIDWGAFDRARARWARRPLPRPREPVGTR